MSTLKFEANVRLRTYGDDNVCKVAKEVEPWFNMMVMRDCFEKFFGMRYTTPGKDEVTKPFLDLSEYVFLSRSFRIIRRETDGTWEYVLAPLELSSILGMLAWVKESKYATIKEQFDINIKTACRELSLYGPEIYERWTTRLLAWAKEVQISMHIQPYEVVFKRIMDVYYVNDQPMYQ